jgi:alpha-tubulin suppressor-like RCC1 family protein
VKVPFPSGTRITDISFGRTHACAADSTGQAWCWGGNENGQLGQALTMTSSPTPVAIALPAGARVVQVTAGQYTSCARTAVGGSAGDVYCWGGNGVGEAGNPLTLSDGGPNTTILVPELVPVFAHDVEYIALSQDAGSQQHACAIRTGGTVWCWGENGGHESGQPSGAFFTQPTQVSGISGATAIAVGPSVSCAVANGVVSCWGANFYSETGTPCTSTSTATPTRVPGLPDAGMLAVASGEWLQFAVSNDGHAYSWGTLNSGGLGTGVLTGRTCSNGLVGVDAPAQISTLSGVVQISAGEVFGVAAKSDGTAYSWGANNLAQLGHLPGAGDAGDALCSDASADFCHPLPSPVTALP